MTWKSRGRSSSHAPRGYVVWTSAVAVYVMAIAGRSSFGVAGLEAIDRFGISAATLSLFTVIQLAVYAGAQIPVGVILDHSGTRRVLIGGALIMATGQILLGIATDLPIALGARVLIGLGDATAYSAVLRLLPAWFAPRHVPMMTQLTGMIGQMGQIISSIPFAYLLSHAGWEPAFVALGSACFLIGGVALVGVRDVPKSVEAEAPPEVAWELDVSHHPDLEKGELRFREVLREPAIWLGFFSHFSCGFMPMVFQLLWGSPFLQVVNDMSKTTAAAMLMVQPLTGLVVGPLIGRLTGLHPLRRTWLVYGSLALVALAWIPFLFGEPRPTWMVIILLMTLAVPSITSAVGFDFVRTSIDVRRMGTGNGVVNMGGFSATLIAAWLIGVVLDARSPSGRFTTADFQAAMAIQLVVLAIGVLGIAISECLLRRQMARNGITIPSLKELWRRYH